MNDFPGLISRKVPAADCLYSKGKGKFNSVSQELLLFIRLLQEFLPVLGPLER